MRSLIELLNCGYVYSYREAAIEFIASKFSDLTDKVIPFFNKYPLRGVKRLDYQD